METITLSASNRDIECAAELIKKGEIVGVPTETVYGLGADALNPDAVKKIFAAKGRPCDNPLIVHIYDLGDAERLACNIPELFYSLAEKFWPGPLTMILSKKDIVPSVTSGGLDTVGIRMPSHEIMRRLIRLSGAIAAPSGNRSGYPSPTCAEHILRDLNGVIPAVIDGGICRFGVESTVIAFESEDTVRILRPGSVTKSMLEEAAVNVIVDEAILNDLQQGRTAPSPGMKYRHYSPKAKVILCEGDFDGFCRFAEGFDEKNACCLVFDDDDEKKLGCRCIAYGGSTDDQARLVFAGLRKADDMGMKTVLVRAPSKDGVGLAVYNRLLRAAGFEVKRV